MFNLRHPRLFFWSHLYPMNGFLTKDDTSEKNQESINQITNFIKSSDMAREAAYIGYANDCHELSNTRSPNSEKK